jgi:hypothetical protein
MPALIWVVNRDELALVKSNNLVPEQRMVIWSSYEQPQNTLEVGLSWNELGVVGLARY